MRIMTIAPMLACLVCFSALCGPATASAIMPPVGDTPEITVHLKSGRRFVAQVDRRTDQRYLWLRFGDKTAVILRPVRWDRVITASIAGRNVSHDKLRLMAERLRTLPVSVQRPPVRPNPIAPPRDIPPLRFGAPRPTLRVTSMDVSVSLGNWDDDVESDGLVIRVSPRDSRVELVRTPCTLRVSLVGQRFISLSEAPRKRGARMEQIGSWSRQVSAEQIGSSGAMFRLPFQGVDPQFDLDMDRIGLVRVALVVPGSGVIERTIDGVRVRPFSVLRDEIQHHTGQRFLPHERTGRPKRSPQPF
jgi:hypothetical protein